MTQPHVSFRHRQDVEEGDGDPHGGEQGAPAQNAWGLRACPRDVSGITEPGPRWAHPCTCVHTCVHAHVYTPARRHTEHVRLLPTSVHDQRGQRRPQLLVCHLLPL